MTKAPYVSAQQKKWFASVQLGLERETEKSLEDWVKIAKTCPESKHRARLEWFKTEHGLGINRASLILGATFKTGLGWSNPDELINRLWKTPEYRAIYDQVEAIAKELGDDVIIAPRKGFSAFSRRVQFAALRPTRLGVRLGLAIPMTNAPNLTPPLSSDSWSDRLTTVQLLVALEDIDNELMDRLREAYVRSG
ncbi:MAG: DUF5655 domain-containing protein [Rhizobiaceae bacterium]